ncbi:hypothetical protein AXXA_27040 [Achromobacter insuavis AXX-A]|uniref:Uncharacterized protein n=1 Tax=Achromobacter insuavis AXX-A TaxID=1003200 RepID=F7T8W2_9BURK|nr:hypothetical protein AXXA_27040 [Achromobacter insuavis AXX-A]
MAPVSMAPVPAATNSAMASPAAPMAAVANSVTAKAEGRAPSPLMATRVKWAGSPPAASQNWRR